MRTTTFGVCRRCLYPRTVSFPRVTQLRPQTMDSFKVQSIERTSEMAYSVYRRYRMSSYDELEIRLFIPPYSFLGLAPPNSPQCHFAGLFNRFNSRRGPEFATRGTRIYSAHTMSSVCLGHIESVESEHGTSPSSSNQCHFKIRNGIATHGCNFERGLGDE